jgi:hypothetical protein
MCACEPSRRSRWAVKIGVVANGWCLLGTSECAKEVLGGRARVRAMTQDGYANRKSTRNARQEKSNEVRASISDGC